LLLLLLLLLHGAAQYAQQLALQAANAPSSSLCDPSPQSNARRQQ
jgi:hypothetical protein